VWSAPDTGATCGAFVQEISKDKPADNFAVTGSRGGQVIVWALPDEDEIKDVLRARVTRIGEEIDTSSRQVPIWAEVDNPKLANGSRRLMPGTSATMVVYPAKAAK
jgi:multidrug efflux pump subunit AcrA (membrane-fusion protein)